MSLWWPCVISSRTTTTDASGPQMPRSDVRWLAACLTAPTTRFTHGWLWSNTTAMCRALLRWRTPDNRDAAGGVRGTPTKRRFHKIALSRCQLWQFDILDMVGVVGSNPIAPTRIPNADKHFACRRCRFGCLGTRQAVEIGQEAAAQAGVPSVPCLAGAAGDGDLARRTLPRRHECQGAALPTGSSVTSATSLLRIASFQCSRPSRPTRTTRSTSDRSRVRSCSLRSCSTSSGLGDPISR